MSRDIRFPTTWYVDQQSLRSACAYAQSDQNLCLSLECSMSVKLLTEHHLEFLSLKGGCTGSSESTLVKMPHCWKSHDHMSWLNFFLSFQTGPMNKMEVDTSTPLYDDDYYIELQKFLEQYNDYDFSITYGQDDQSIGIVTSDHLDIAQMVMLILSVIIGVLVLVVFCTVFSGKARAVSASWYSYSLALETIILALIFTPIVHASMLSFFSLAHYSIFEFGF